MSRHPRTSFNAYAVGASIALAALLFYIGETFPTFQHALRSAGYVGTFVLGLLYVSSVTSLSAAALLFLIGRSQNIWLAGGLATLGAVVGDLVIFALFRSAKPFAAAHPDPERYSGWWAAIETHVPPAWQSFVLMSVVVVFLLLPLPNEFADYVLARTRKITPWAMLAISSVFNGIGIYGLLWLARRG